MKISAKRLLLLIMTIWVFFVLAILYRNFTSDDEKFGFVGVLKKTTPLVNNVFSEDILPKNLAWSKVKYNLNEIPLDVLQRLFREVNRLQYVRNSKFKADLSKLGTVILVQVHDRENDVKELINSLRDVKGISSTLVIFSHDLFSPTINKLIEEIDFCPVMQIFFPYSLQLFKDEFPSDSSSDCPRDVDKDEAKASGCTNADYPDTFGHYREAKFAQMKHHWAWKLNFVFKEIRILKNYEGVVLRIDDDYYLGPDIVFTMRKLRSDSTIVRNDTNSMLIMGGYEDFEDDSYEIGASTFIKDYWYTGVGRGMGINKQLWDRISQCSEIFCTFDDYNWDFSLQKLIDTCLHGVVIFKPMATRIFHLGKCQGFHRQNVCSREALLAKVRDFIKSSEKYLFPQTLTILTDFNIVQRPVTEQTVNGGWADPRDHKLCRTFFK